MDRFILKILLRIVKFFAGKDVDFERLKIITETKVMMDRRRTPVSWRKKQQKQSANPMLGVLVINTLFSGFIGIIIFIIPSLFASMVIVHTYLIFMMSMTLITDFSTVLLDTSDNQIILPKPISSRTLFVSRLVHIMVYLLQFGIAFAGLPLIFVFIKYGFLSGLACFITLTLTVGLSVVVTYLLYALILRFGNEQKIKNIIGYFQIAMTLFVVIGFQVIPRLVDMDNISFNFTPHWYSYLLPPVWSAMTIEAVHFHNFNEIHILMILLSLLIPSVTLWLMVKFIAPSFSKKIAMLGNNNEVTKKIKGSIKTRKDLSDSLAPVFCDTALESAGFEKVWKITSRDKNFKIKFYPGVGYMFVLIFIILFRHAKNIGEMWRSLHNSKMYLAFIYAPIFAMASSLIIIPYYDNYQASWIYQSAPLNKPGEIISGAIKALLVKFFIPFFLILFIAAYFIWGNQIIDDFAFGFFNNIFILLLLDNFSDHYLPFSCQQDLKKQSGKMIRAILNLIILGILIGIHYAALQISWLVIALIPFFAVGDYFLLKRIQNLSWSKISI